MGKSNPEGQPYGYIIGFYFQFILVTQALTNKYGYFGIYSKDGLQNFIIALYQIAFRRYFKPHPEDWLYGWWEILFIHMGHSENI